jgi:predicted ATPase
VDELGIEPGKALRDLERQVLQQSSALDPAATAPRAATPPLVVGNLPALSTPLVGRTDDLAAVAGLIDGNRLVTLVGPAGVGKTRTALEAVRQLRPGGGVWLVRLEVADATTSIWRSVTEAPQLTGGEQTLLDRMAGAESVLVLDNCEHVLAGVVDLATRLLDRAAPLRSVATSQAPLGVDGEATYVLDPLPLPDSVTLFADRAARMRRHFALDDDTAATVEAVCRSLDGLPLAIELAAARVRSLSVQEIARRLDDRFALLQDPTSRRPERRRALAAAIAWSYDLLFPDDQRGLWALSCFAGGAPLAAAEQVMGGLGVPGTSAVDVIGRLADRSMLSVETTEDGATLTRCLLAALSVEQDEAAAVGDLHTVLEEARIHHDLETQTLSLDSLAHAAAAGGDLRRAARLRQEADDLHAQVRHTLDDADRVDATTARASLRAVRPGGLEGAGEPVGQDVDRLG